MEPDCSTSFLNAIRGERKLAGSPLFNQKKIFAWLSRPENEENGKFCNCLRCALPQHWNLPLRLWITCLAPFRNKHVVSVGSPSMEADRGVAKTRPVNLSDASAMLLYSKWNPQRLWSVWCPRLPFQKRTWAGLKFIRLESDPIMHTFYKWKVPTSNYTHKECIKVKFVIISEILIKCVRIFYGKHTKDSDIYWAVWSIFLVFHYFRITKCDKVVFSV